MREKEIIRLVMEDRLKHLDDYKINNHFLAMCNSLDEKVVREWQLLPFTFRSEITTVLQSTPELCNKSLNIESINLLRELQGEVLAEHIVALLPLESQNNLNFFYQYFFSELLDECYREIGPDEKSEMTYGAVYYQWKTVGQFFKDNVTQDIFFDDAIKFCIEIYGENYGLVDLCYLLTYCKSLLANKFLGILDLDGNNFSQGFDSFQDFADTCIVIEHLRKNESERVVEINGGNIVTNYYFQFKRIAQE